ncbi:MAG: hypothetical protein LBD49_05375 [Oscillospiraceae bacterium]|nr:hypothetical protein [Oscillospiraceae bacterium]
MKKRAALLLTAFLCLSLASCAREAAPVTSAPSGEPSAPPVPLEHAYTETELPVDAKGASLFAYFGGKLYYDKQGAPGGASIISASLDGSEEAAVWRREVAAPYSEASPGYTLSCFSVDGEGNIFTVSSFAYPDENDPNVMAYREELIKTSPDGAELYACDLASLPGGEPSAITAVETDGAGNVYLFDEGKGCLYVFDGASGEPKFTVTEPAGTQIAAMALANDGQILYIALTYSQPPDAPGVYIPSYVMKTIDFAAGTATEGEAYDASDGVYFTKIYAGSGDYAFYFMNGAEMFGFKLGEMAAETVLSFMNSDLDPYEYSYSEFIAIEDSGFIAPKLDASHKARSVSRLTPNPDATLGGKTVLRLSTLYLDSLTTVAVLGFNKSSETARVEVRDFKYDTTQFDLDLMGKDPPDILCLSQVPSDMKYISKGVFADLCPYLDADETISRGDLFGNVLEALSVDGKLYSVAPFFTVSTMAGKQSVFGDITSITPDELLAVADKYPDAAIYASALGSVSGQEAWMQHTLQALSRYVNIETGEVSFDSPEFIAQLKLSERMPPAVDTSLLSSVEAWNEFLENYRNAHRENKQLLESVYIYNPRAARTLETDLFEEPVAFVGIPGAGGGTISPGARYAVSASSENPEAAWSFISSMLAENFEPDFLGSGSIFIMNREVKQELLPLNRNIFERRAREEMTPLAERPSSDGIEIAEFLSMQLVAYVVPSLDELDMTLPKYQNYALTEEDISRVRDAIEGASELMSSDSTMLGIAFEELGAFYAGAKTAEDTARIIQSRAALYVSENR